MDLFFASFAYGSAVDIMQKLILCRRDVALSL
jgi:hypothetical protein